MSGLADAIPDLDSVTGSRFSLVSYVPTWAGAAFLAFVLAGGAPGQHFELSRARARLEALDGVDLAALVFAVLLVAVVLQPLQLSVVRLLEGYWPRPIGVLTRAGVALQRRPRNRLVSRADLTGATQPELEQGRRQRALEAAWRLRSSFPDEALLLPTRLGNVLRAMEYDAGHRYGADTVTWWPRLYVVLGDQMRGVVDDRRNQLDAACRLAATCAVVGLASLPLLWTSGWWLATALVPLSVAFVSYQGAVAAARAYGESVRAAFDLHRFDLLRQLHLTLPATPQEELALNRKVTRFWLQGVPLTGVTWQHQDGHGD